VLLGGITIGDRAVIGAGSVVVKNVAAEAVVAGNPARVIGPGLT
jgi:acetyltransferase-like isoleucine patch superfamily enzyme